jgi:hypothetical protein
MALRFDRESILDRLEPIRYAPEERRDLQLEQTSLAGTLLALAEVNHEREYEVCRAAALHLLGKIDEPEDIVLE